MQRLEVSDAVRTLQWSLGVKRLTNKRLFVYYLKIWSTSPYKIFDVIKLSIPTRSLLPPVIATATLSNEEDQEKTPHYSWLWWIYGNTVRCLPL